MDGRRTNQSIYIALKFQKLLESIGLSPKWVDAINWRQCWTDTSSVQPWSRERWSWSLVVCLTDFHSIQWERMSIYYSTWHHQFCITSQSLCYWNMRSQVSLLDVLSSVTNWVIHMQTHIILAPILVSCLSIQPSVCLPVCDVEVCFSHRLEYF